MIDPQQAQQAAPQLINWSINIFDLAVICGWAGLLYGRLVKVETQIAPIVAWWNQMIQAEHQAGRRWTDSVSGNQPGGHA